MGDDRDRRKPAEASETAEADREIRPGHAFSLADAIGQSAGGLMKGASPITRKRQAELEIELYLERWLPDAEGALPIVLLRRARESSRLLAGDRVDPLAALAALVGRLAASEERLREFVRDVDAEWGRIYDERPYFDREGQPPHRKDPYTVDSVREKLESLLGTLKSTPPED